MRDVNAGRAMLQRPDEWLADVRRAWGVLVVLIVMPPSRSLQLASRVPWTSSVVYSTT